MAEIFSLTNLDSVRFRPYIVPGNMAGGEHAGTLPYSLEMAIAFLVCLM